MQKALDFCFSTVYDNPVFDTLEKTGAGIPLFYKEFRLLLLFQNVVWKIYPDIFLNFLFKSLGW